MYLPCSQTDLFLFFKPLFGPLPSPDTKSSLLDTKDIRATLLVPYDVATLSPNRLGSIFRSAALS